jgi:hypothetical protein
MRRMYQKPIPSGEGKVRECVTQTQANTQQDRAVNGAGDMRSICYSSYVLLDMLCNDYNFVSRVYATRDSACTPQRYAREEAGDGCRRN